MWGPVAVPQGMESQEGLLRKTAIPLAAGSWPRRGHQGAENMWASSICNGAEV